MKIENHGKNIFLGKKNRQAYFFSMKIKMMDLWMQIEGTKLMFIMNFGELDYFKFAPRMPQIVQTLVSSFKTFRGSVPPNPTRNFLFFFLQHFHALLFTIEQQTWVQWSLSVWIFFINF